MSRCTVITTGHLHADHIAALEGLHGPVTVERRCADLAELIAVSKTSRAAAALIIGTSEQLTVTLLAELRNRGLRVVVISDVAAERSRLSGIGVTALRDDTDAETLSAALLGEHPLPPPPPPPGLTVRVGSPETEGVSQTASGERGQKFEQEAAAAGEAIGVTGRVGGRELAGGRRRKDGGQPPVRPGLTVVWGSGGSPGRTMLAVNLAAELALSGENVLVIDADTSAASVTSYLGLLEETAGLAQACRQADLGRLDQARLRRALTTVQVASHRMSLLTGIPRADRWPELREKALRKVLEQVRGEFDHVIVDTASPLEHDEELTYDTEAPQRHAATLTVLDEADLVLAVGTADAVGYPRLLKSVEDFRHTFPQAGLPYIVVNQVRPEAVGRSPEDQLRETWELFGPPGSGIGAFLPWDLSSLDAALLKGQVLAEARPQSPLRRAIAELAGIALPQPRPRLFRLLESSAFWPRSR